MSLSASYDVDLAKQYGIPAAVLYNKLIYLSRYTTREDGYVWRTAEEIENELGLSAKTQRTAIEKLEAAGMILTKNTYVQGTMIKCKHFYITDREAVSGANLILPKGKNQKVPKGQNVDCAKRVESFNNNQTNNQNNNNQKENIKEKETRKAYGMYENVFLTDTQFEKLKSEFIDYTDRIERLSLYKKSAGKKYADDLATIRNWARRDKPKQPAAISADADTNAFDIGDLPF